MTGLMVTFVVAFVLVLVAVCALLVLRSLGTFDLPQSPPFPRHRLHYRHAGAGASRPPQRRP